MTDKSNTQAVEAAAFRKKPVTIHAVQWDGTYSHAKQLEAVLGLNTTGMTSHPENNTCSYWRIATLEDGHVVSPLDWIITGVKGEHYPCKPDIFELTYERAALTSQQEEVAAPSRGLYEAEREPFEKWALAHNYSIERADLGLYKCNVTNHCFRGWLALAASRSPAAGVAGGVDASRDDPLHDFVTHRDNWRKAILNLVEQADDDGWWKHELAAYDHAMRQFDLHFAQAQPSPHPAVGEPDEAVKQWGLGLLAKAKETAMERAALAAYNEHFFKCTPSCTVADWTTAWKKAIAFWTTPNGRADVGAKP